MSSAVCQGLQSCLEPWPKLTATRPYFARSLSLTQSAPISDSESEKNLKEKSNSNDNKCSDCDIDKNNKNQSSCSVGDMGGWSFIQALTNTSEGPKAAAEEKEKLYIHPLVKRSSSKLSERSLEMCTENLGSETGSVISEDDIVIQSPTREGRERPKSSPSLRQLTGVNSREFPPPLTTIRWSSQVQVTTHREGGRLLMKAVRVPCSQSYFEAERGDGRLRLHLSTNFSQRFDPEFDSQDAAAEEEADSEEEAEIEGEEEGMQEDDRGEGEEEYDDDVKYWGGGTNGNNGNVGVEMEMGKYERRRRCNEGGGHRNKLMLIQEPCCWVATS